MICGEKYVTIKDLYSEEKRVEFRIFSTLLSFSFYATSHFYSLFLITLAYVFVTVVSDYYMTLLSVLHYCLYFTTLCSFYDGTFFCFYVFSLNFYDISFCF